MWDWWLGEIVEPIKRWIGDVDLSPVLKIDPPKIRTLSRRRYYRRIMPIWKRTSYMVLRRECQF